MNVCKRILSVVLVLAMVIGMFPAIVSEAHAAEAVPQVTVDSMYGKAGNTVDVALKIKNNPGILGAEIQITFDPGLTLLDVQNGEAFASLAMQFTDNKRSPIKVAWSAYHLDQILDGEMLRLHFKINEDAGVDKIAAVTVDYNRNNIIRELPDGSLQEGVDLEITNGGIQIIDYTPGDVDGNGAITPKDSLMLLRYLVGSTVAKFSPKAADVNGSGSLNAMDTILIQRYVAGGYGVILKPAPVTSAHKMEAIPYKAATCTKAGNLAYWHCTECGKYFSDKDGSKEITLDKTVLKALGHLEVVIPAEDGYTEGVKCSRCGLILKAPEKIPDTQYPINYHICDNDAYLHSIGAEKENPNPATYSERTGLKLRNMSIPGYVFVGWYDGAASNAAQIKEIPAKSTGPVDLYAHWEKVPYTVEFDSPDVPVDNKEYTVDKGVFLPKPKHFGYTFVGWSIDGEVISEIKPGTLPVNSNKIVVHANWTSDRNRTQMVSELDKPVIIEDVADGRYLFLYRIGEIQNVPLHVNKDWGKVNNLDVTQTIEVSDTVQDDLASTAASAVSNATTKSSAWTLSEDWNQSSQATTETGEKQGRTDAKTNSDGTTTASKYYVGNNQSGTTSVSTSGGGSASASAKVTNQTSTGLSGSYGKQWGETHEDERKHSVDVGVHGSVGTKPGKVKPGWNVEAGVDYNYTNDQKDTSYEKNSLEIAASRNDLHETVGTTSGEAHWDCSQSTSNSWNTSSGYESSRQESHNTTVSNTISDEVFKKWQISSTVDHNLSQSENKATSDTNELKNEYTSSVEHSTIQHKSRTEQVTYSSPVEGHYRHVTAGTVHVFAVVGYDIATKSYFTYTYNVLDHERHPFLDYSMPSANGKYEDCENGVLPFEVPYEVNEYVCSALAGSDGLEVEPSTGHVTKYTGSDDYVTIPEYVSVNNKDGTFSAVKVTGIESNVFQGKNIAGVAFPKYVNAIPADAFQGCTNLKEIICKGVSSIGDRAFQGCTSLASTSKSGTFYVDKHITTLGENVFDGVAKVKVDASTAAVANNAVKCGAKDLTLRLVEVPEYNNQTITVGADTDTFRLWDGGKVRTNLQIDSSAKHTELNNLKLVGNKKLPVKISSPKLSLNRVVVENAPGLAMALLADKTDIDLYGNVELGTASKDAVLARKIALTQTDPVVKGALNVKGNVLLTDLSITGKEMLHTTDGAIMGIDPDKFENYLNSHKMTLNANGGQVSPDSKIVSYGAPYGELPVPTRTGYTFDGWYTAAEGGSKVSSATICNSPADFTIYAHWTAKAYTVNWNSATGCTIQVSRTESPYVHASTGTLSAGATVYYGDVLAISYNVHEGYELTGHGITSAEVTEILTASDIYASARVKSYSVNWNSGTGYGITVRRTSSPIQGASSGNLSSGSTVYYGDVLSISYAANTGYSLTDSGETSITVRGNVGSDRIYASARVNSYTYDVVYKSTNGTRLGSTTVTHEYGGSYRVEPRGFSGYNTPGAQTVAWDSTGRKTITFVYAPTGVASTQTATSGNWWVSGGGTPCLTYTVEVELGRRTANSIQARIKWTNWIRAKHYYGFQQCYNCSIGGVWIGDSVICTSSEWANPSNSARTKTVRSQWVTIPLNTTGRTTIGLHGQWWANNGDGGHNYSGSFTVPAY